MKKYRWIKKFQEKKKSEKMNNAYEFTDNEILFNKCKSPEDYMLFYDGAKGIAHDIDWYYAIDYDRQAPSPSQSPIYTITLPNKTMVCRLPPDKSSSGLFFNFFMFSDVCDTHVDSVFFTNSQPCTLFIINSANLLYLHDKLVEKNTDDSARVVLSWLEEFTGIGSDLNFIFMRG